MARSYFAILEVTSDATPDEVHSAYRRLAKAFHPDYYGGDSEPFQQIHEAYSVLGNPDKRKAYERTLPDRQVRSVPGITPSSEPEPLIPKNGPVDLGEISPIHSFETFSTSFDEIFDWLWDSLFSVNPIKSSQVQNLTLEVPITREQAIRGGTATIMVPAQTICRTCRGYGHIGYYDCHQCAGEGVISGRVPLSVTFPQGWTKDHSVVIPLDRFGIRNLYFTVQFRLRDVD